MAERRLRLRDTWKLLGSCRGKPSEWWFPLSRALAPQNERAVAICRLCPVQVRCWKYALKNGETGIWGGTTDEQRDEVRRRTMTG